MKKNCKTEYVTGNFMFVEFAREAAEGELKLLEAEEAWWLTKETLFCLGWFSARQTLLEEIKKKIKYIFFWILTCS